MSIEADKLIQKVLDFMTVLYQCYKGTTYTEDRVIYAKDIAIAMGWLVEIRGNCDIKELVDEILSPETDKYFGDYWRQGEWGENEMAALEKLKRELEFN